MFGLGGGELLLVAFMALIFIGPKKLPELARGLGQGIREFKGAVDGVKEEMNDAKDKVDKDVGINEKNDD